MRMTIFKGVLWSFKCGTILILTIINLVNGSALKDDIKPKSNNLTIDPSTTETPCQKLEGSSGSGIECLRISTSMSKQRLGIREDTWVIPLMALAAFNMTVIAFFEIFILVKIIYTRPSRRHLFLGQVLLFGLFLASLLGFAFITYPNTITCTVIRMGLGLSYSIILATLLVKCIFLISLNSGVYLPAAYLGLLLFFTIAVQLVIGIQWLVLLPPDIIFSDDVQTSSSDSVAVAFHSPPRCNTNFTDLLLSLVYVMFLLLLICILSLKSCNIRDNYREATYIAITACFLVVIWLAWVVVGFVLGHFYEDLSLAYGLVASSSVTFLVMFLPKGRQLAAMGQEGLFVEDRDDMLSNATPSAAAYAPSFYHFTPTFVPMWGNPTNTIYKTAMIENKCHKIASPNRFYSYRLPYKSRTSEVAGANLSRHTTGRRNNPIISPNLHNSMMY